MDKTRTEYAIITIAPAETAAGLQMKITTVSATTVETAGARES